MKQLFAFILLAFLLAFLPNSQVQGQPTKERAKELENSPARQRLDEIQQYKPVIRRSRAIAIQEMEREIAAAYFKIEAAEKVLTKQERLARRNDPEAWTPEQMAAAREQMSALEDYVEEAEEYLDVARAEHEKVLQLLARERSEHEIEEDDEEYEEDEGEGNSSLSIPGSGGGLDAAEPDEDEDDE